MFISASDAKNAFSFYKFLTFKAEKKLPKIIQGLAVRFDSCQHVFSHRPEGIACDAYEKFFFREHMAKETLKHGSFTRLRGETRHFEIVSVTISFVAMVTDFLRNLG